MQSWVDAVLSSSLLSGPPLSYPVLKWLVYLVIAGVVLSCSGEFGSLWSGPTLCGPALEWVLFIVVRSYIVWSGLTVGGSPGDRLPGDIPGDGRPWFALVRSYMVWSGLTVGGAELGWCGLVLFALDRSYIVWSGLTVVGLPGDRRPCAKLSG